MFKIVLILLATNSLFEMVFLPFLSSQYKNNKSEFNNTAKLINKIIIIFGLSLFVFYNLFIQYIVNVLYSDKYLIGLSIAFPLGLILLFRIQSTVYSFILTISHHQNMRVVAVLLSLIVNVILNFIYIPQYGIHAAAYVSVATHILILISYIAFSNKYIKSFLIDKSTLLFVLFISSTITLANYTNIQLNLWYSLFSLLIYGLALVFIFNKEQRMKVKQILMKSY